MILNLHIGLSNRCNLKCKHCFVPYSEKTDIDEKILFKFIKKIENYGLSKVYYTYGEPLLNKNFNSFALKIKALDIYQVLMTNGTLINQKKINELTECGINFVYVSLDSTIDVEHDDNRGGKCFHKAVEAIRLLNKNGIACGISSTVMPQNIEYINSMADFSKEIGVTDISFLMLREEGRVTTPLTKNYVELFKESVRKDLPYSFHDMRLNIVLKKMYDDGVIGLRKYERYRFSNDCHNEMSLSISPSGSLYRCNFHQKEPIGNLYKITEDNFEEILKKKIKGCEFKCAI
ncbi:MAG: radical SAM protein [Streptococcaceae bacterium]|jgi:MoaA/NifB/PqqE/SkfB family radical SAM enzyme|nr:radical SAM protein [Streptococcaceae bacterium]